MRKIFKSTKNSKGRILYTFLTIVLLICVFSTMIIYTYQGAKNDGYDGLHMRTKEIKDDLSLQMISDRENLITMANFASKLYSDGESYDLIVKNFKPIGLIDNVGILLPDNKLVTRVGVVENPAGLDFEEESAKGMYISGKVADVTVDGAFVVRSAVPVVADGKTVAMLYGSINLKHFEERYAQNISLDGANLYILEAGNGNFIMDTQHNNVGNITSLRSRKYLDGFTYEQLAGNVVKGNSGYSSFISAFTGEVLYLHYSPMDIGDWVIMLSLPEKLVFAEAAQTGYNLSVMFILLVAIMILYVLLFFYAERKQSALNFNASNIRKLLLEINQHSESIVDALNIFTKCAASRSAFYIDSDGECFEYVTTANKSMQLEGEEKEYFIGQLLTFAKRNRKDRSMPVNVFHVSVDGELEREDEVFYNLMQKHGIGGIMLSCISSANESISIIGTVNPRKKAIAKKLLEEISVCFSMAIYNKKYLDKTEFVAVTDSLTGLSNRTAFKKDIIRLDSNLSDMLACVYIDVNELHYVNNKYGHAAGDGMLIYIANSLKAVFEGCNIYRIGGDEFLVFAENSRQDDVLECIKMLEERVEERNYHISVGMAYGLKNTDTEVLVSTAEKRMYEAKAEYYQKKGEQIYFIDANDDAEYNSTGIKDYDALLEIMKGHYSGIYKVALNTDYAQQILMPAYLKNILEDETKFSKIYPKYVSEFVKPDYHRAMLSFLKYDVLGKQLADGHVPSIAYERNDGGKYKLSVYPVSQDDRGVGETMWVFEKES